MTGAIVSALHVLNNAHIINNTQYPPEVGPILILMVELRKPKQREVR